VESACVYAKRCIRFYNNTLKKINEGDVGKLGERERECVCVCVCGVCV